MKFYIASSFKNIERVKYVSEKLIAKGYTQTYDWTKNNRASTIDQLRHIGQKEKDAVCEADFLVVLFPAGKGSHVELGIALGRGKKVYLYSENEDINDFETTTTFYHLNGIEKCIGTIDDLIRLVSA
ncbi:nucleoside 2-deoxyribosyltransferase [Cytobacillus sp. Hm23]